MDKTYSIQDKNEHWQDWHWQVANSLIDKAALDGLRHMGVFLPENAEDVAVRYPVNISPYYLSLIDADDPDDPIALQCRPSSSELDDDLYPCDPFSEHDQMPVDGLVHRFSDRALLLATTKCAVNCRHCTRKNWITSSDKTAPRNMDAIIEYLQVNDSIREIIISGGDPLMMETDDIAIILERLSEVDHVRVLRLGTRVPVVLPMRVDDALCNLLRAHRPLWVNTQFNHPRELTVDAVAACRRLVDSGIQISNQSVLLKGVNDSEEVCKELFTKLQENMIRPYYMFLCDPVKGTSGFRVEAEVGIAIEEALRKQIGGLALPKFVADFPEEDGKVQLSSI